MKHALVFAAVLLIGLCTAAHALTLDEAIALGKSRSLAMQDPQIDRTSIRGQITEAWSNALPQVEGTVGYQHALKAGKVFFPNPDTGDLMQLKMQQDHAMQADVILNQPLFTFGRVAAGLRAAYSAKRSNDHMQSNTDRSVELEVMRRFWGVLLMRNVVDVRTASLAISDSSLARARRMRDVGLMSDYDVLRVQVQAQNQRPPLQDAINNLNLAELSLREFLGIPLDTAITVAGTLGDYSVAVDTTDGVARVMVRDDLEALRDLAGMQKNIYTIYRNAIWPTLGGQIKYSWQWQNDEWDINPRNNLSSIYAGVALNIPIWSSGYHHGRAQQHKADWRRAELNLVKAERGARLQYESAVRNYQTALESEDASRTAVEQAEQARQIAQTKFSQGQITPLEMDAAQLDELVAKVALAQAQYNRLAAGAEVRMAAGMNPNQK